MLDEANGAIEHSENQQSDTSAVILKVSFQDEFSSVAFKLFSAGYLLRGVRCS